MRNLSYENEFCTQFHFHANQSHFHKNGFALRLALKQRHKGSPKWPVGEYTKVLFFFPHTYNTAQLSPNVPKYSSRMILQDFERFSKSLI